MTHSQQPTTHTTQSKSQVNDSIITAQPVNPVTPVIQPENVRVGSSSELALLVAFGMVMAVFAANIKK